MISNDSNGICGASGYRTNISWADLHSAARVADRITASAGVGDITRNLHLVEAWAKDAITCRQVLGLVQALIGRDVAVVEPTFLMTKRPGGQFALPAHQDGLNDRMCLDPARSAAVWLAVTDATITNGCLEVVPGSQTRGYLPHEWGRDARGRGRPFTLTEPSDDSSFIAIPLKAGQACAMDVRLVHRSAVNTTAVARIGLNICFVAPGGLDVHHGPPPELYVVSGGW